MDEDEDGMAVDVAELGWSAFFDDKKGFVARRLADFLADEIPIARGGGEAYIWQDGVYAPGEVHLQRRIGQLLEEKFTTARANETIKILRMLAEDLEDRPSLDRIAVRNGLVDVETGVLHPPDHTHRSPVRIDAHYDPDARCERFEQFLVEVTDGDKMLRQLLVELLGYLLTPDVSQQKAFLLIGGGGNGKSTYLNVVRSLLGQENVGTVSWRSLGQRFTSSGLYGKLANFDPDLDPTAVAMSEVFKTVTDGEEAIRGERKYKDAFSFRPYVRLVFAANQVPRSRDFTDGYFRRWVVIPFDRRFDNTGMVDKMLVRKLTTPEARSGILNTALAGLQSLRERGRFEEGGRARQALSDFEKQSDPVAGFLAYACRYDDGLWVERSAVHGAIRSWASRNGYPPASVPTQHATPARVRQQIERQALPMAETKYDGIWRYRGMAFREDVI